MFETELRINFLSDWHVGSGLGDGAIADSVLNRDTDGLPWLPGRAVKGALREGAWRLGKCREDLEFMVDYLWGTDSVAKISNEPGKATVSSGRLPEDLAEWLLRKDPASRAQYVGDMTILRIQTKLDRNKMVVPHSLRTIECGIPGVFFISSVAINAPKLDDNWLKTYLAAVCASVKSMGADRARGLGQCEISMSGQKDAFTRLPAQIDTNTLAEEMR